MTERQRHIPSLDGFRAVSIILVITGHLLLNTALPGSLTFFAEHFNLSGLGVSFFFVISGFLITHLLLIERDRNQYINLANFYRRRILRIFPAFYAYLIIVGSLAILSEFNLSFLKWLSAALYIQNFRLFGNNWYVSHTWSLAVEEQFYLVWPLLFVRFDFRHLPKAWLGMVALGTLMRIIAYKFPGTSIYVLAPFFSYCDVLFTGCAMAYVYHYRRDSLLTFFKSFNIIPVSGAAVILILMSALESHPSYTKYLIPLSGGIGDVLIGFIVLYFIIHTDSLGYKILNSQPFIFIGKISYGLYLWQQLFLGASPNWFTHLPQSLVCIVIAAIVSYFIIERPFLRLKEKYRYS